MSRTALGMAVALALAAPAAAAASLAPNGLGQVLVFPYYSAQSRPGSAIDTYLSIVNHGDDEKALRVRVREARHGKEVGSFNLYLARNDVWTGAILPTAGGARLVTRDTTCMEPVPAEAPEGAPLRQLELHARGYAGDGAGEGLDRTREGFIEVLEMGTLTGSSAAQSFHNAAGLPMGCPALVADPAPTVARPTGGLSGTLTLIDVSAGMDFTVPAEALADVASRPYFRKASDPYPSLDAAEVDPVSDVTTGGYHYHSLWQRGRDAVNAVLMRTSLLAEFTKDPETRSRSEFIVTLPTWPLFPGPGSPPPFHDPPSWVPFCAETPFVARGERVRTTIVARDQRYSDFTLAGSRPPALCSPVSAIRVLSVELLFRDQPSLFNSAIEGLEGISMPTRHFPNGFVVLSRDSPAPEPVLVSLPGSTRIELATGAVTAGEHTFRGLPLLGFAVRSFENGTLRCEAGACQGSYGAAVPLRYRRSITPPG